MIPKSAKSLEVLYWFANVFLVREVWEDGPGKLYGSMSPYSFYQRMQQGQARNSGAAAAVKVG